ncbi:MAG TPA: hypothetical protein VF698_16790 [Thermoanaerobaculia bacterium]|jgi:hypothetical protein
MLPFVAGDYFRRKRKPRRPTDDVPSEPIFQLVAFWVLLVYGSLFAALAIVGGIAALFFGVEFDRVPTVLMIAFGAISPVLLWGAMRFWFRMKG